MDENRQFTQNFWMKKKKKKFNKKINSRKLKKHRNNTYTHTY